MSDHSTPTAAPAAAGAKKSVGAKAWGMLWPVIAFGAVFVTITWVMGLYMKPAQANLHDFNVDFINFTRDFRVTWMTLLQLILPPAVAAGIGYAVFKKSSH